jgi:hypothetical protein
LGFQEQRKETKSAKTMGWLFALQTIELRARRARFAGQDCILHGKVGNLSYVLVAAEGRTVLSGSPRFTIRCKSKKDVPLEFAGVNRRIVRRTAVAFRCQPAPVTSTIASANCGSCHWPKWMSTGTTWRPTGVFDGS